MAVAKQTSGSGFLDDPLDGHVEGSFEDHFNDINDEFDLDGDFLKNESSSPNDKPSQNDQIDSQIEFLDEPKQSGELQDNDKGSDVLIESEADNQIDFLDQQAEDNANINDIESTEQASPQSGKNLQEVSNEPGSFNDFQQRSNEKPEPTQEPYITLKKALQKESENTPPLRSNSIGKRSPIQSSGQITDMAKILQNEVKPPRNQKRQSSQNIDKRPSVTKNSKPFANGNPILSHKSLVNSIKASAKSNPVHLNNPSTVSQRPPLTNIGGQKLADTENRKTVGISQVKETQGSPDITKPIQRPINTVKPVQSFPFSRPQSKGSPGNTKPQNSPNIPALKKLPSTKLISSNVQKQTVLTNSTRLVSAIFKEPAKNDSVRSIAKRPNTAQNPKPALPADDKEPKDPKQANLVNIKFDDRCPEKSKNPVFQKYTLKPKSDANKENKFSGNQHNRVNSSLAKKPAPKLVKQESEIESEAKIVITFNEEKPAQATQSSFKKQTNAKNAVFKTNQKAQKLTTAQPVSMFQEEEATQGTQSQPKGPENNRIRIQSAAAKINTENKSPESSQMKNSSNDPRKSFLKDQNTRPGSAKDNGVSKKNGIDTASVFGKLSKLRSQIEKHNKIIEKSLNFCAKLDLSYLEEDTKVSKKWDWTVGKTPIKDRFEKETKDYIKNREKEIIAKNKLIMLKKQKMLEYYKKGKLDTKAHDPSQINEADEEAEQATPEKSVPQFQEMEEQALCSAVKPQRSPENIEELQDSVEKSVLRFKNEGKISEFDDCIETNEPEIVVKEKKPAQKFENRKNFKSRSHKKERETVIFDEEISIDKTEDLLASQRQAPKSTYDNSPQIIPKVSSHFNPETMFYKLSAGYPVIAKSQLRAKIKENDGGFSAQLIFVIERLDLISREFLTLNDFLRLLSSSEPNLQSPKPDADSSKQTNPLKSQCLKILEQINALNSKLDTKRVQLITANSETLFAEIDSIKSVLKPLINQYHRLLQVQAIIDQKSQLKKQCSLSKENSLEYEYLASTTCNSEVSPVYKELDQNYMEYYSEVKRLFDENHSASKSKPPKDSVQKLVLDDIFIIDKTEDTVGKVQELLGIFKSASRIQKAYRGYKLHQRKPISQAIIKTANICDRVNLRTAWELLK